MLCEGINTYPHTNKLKYKQILGRLWGVLVNYRQIYAKKKENEKKILKACPNCPNTSGIYFLLREENGFKFGYIGQAKHLLSRLAQHLSGYQHIDLSIKKHGLWSEENPTGYRVHFSEFDESLLDKMEQKYIKQYANAGYQMRNATSGSQGVGKKGLDNARPIRTYYDGLSQGRKNTQKFIADLFAKHLDYKSKKEPPNAYQKRALEKFKDFLEGENDD